MHPSLLVLPLLVLVEVHANLAPRHLDKFSTGFMMEDGNMRGAAPECGGLGWVYHNGHCYLFDRFSSLKTTLVERLDLPYRANSVFNSALYYYEFHNIFYVTHFQKLSQLTWKILQLFAENFPINVFKIAVCTLLISRRKKSAMR